MWRSRSATSTRRSTGMARSSTSTCAAAASAAPSSTWATSSSTWRGWRTTSSRAAGAAPSAFLFDDRSSVKARAEAAGAKMVEGPFLDFLDPWGNRIEVIEYSNIQFTKAPHVLRGMGLDLDKNANARKELAEKGMAPE